MKIGESKIVIKPAMFVLIGAILVGVIVIGFAQFSSGSRTPAYGLVKPKGWKFVTQDGAKANITADGQKGSGGSGQLVDADTGFRVVVSHPGTSADQVSVSNGLNLDQVSGDKVNLTFEAKSPKPIPLTVAISGLETNPAPGSAPLWRQVFPINSSDWKSYQADIPVANLRKQNLMGLVISLQMGATASDVSLRNISLH